MSMLPRGEKSQIDRTKTLQRMIPAKLSPVGAKWTSGGVRRSNLQSFKISGAARKMEGRADRGAG